MKAIDRADALQVDGESSSDYATETAIGLLDALHDAMTLARPGRDCARYAGDLRRLADGAGYVAQELEGLLYRPRAGAAEEEPRARPQSAVA